MVAELIQAGGVVLVLLALADIFLTVLHPRGDSGLLSPTLYRAVWVTVREACRLRPGRRGNSILAYAGPLALVASVALWVSLITLGFALIAWPELGHGIHVPDGAQNRGFATALFYSGADLTTLSPGEGFAPQSTAMRFSAVLDSLLGMSLVTLALTYFLSIYSALIRRNAFAAELHFMTARTGDAAEMLVRVGSGGQFDGAARAQLGSIARELLQLLQTHHAYPVIHLFQQGDVATAPSRVALVALDTVSLVRSVLDPDAYRDFINCAATEVLWDGGMRLLIETGRDILNDADRDATESPHAGEWRARYVDACAKLTAAGFAVDPDRARGEAAYARQRRRWDTHIRAFAAYRGQRWEDVDTMSAGATAGANGAT